MLYKNIFFAMLFMVFLGRAHCIFAMKRSDGVLEKNYNKQLFEACREGGLKRVGYCLDNGANVDAEDDKKLKPLHLACVFGHIDIVKVLINSGADIDSKTSKLLTSLHCAVLSRQVAIVQYLLSMGIDVDAQSMDGRTALDLVSGNAILINLFPNQSGEGMELFPN